MVSSMSTAQGRDNTQRQFEDRINMNYTSIRKLCYDIKIMYKANTGHKFIFVVVDEATNYSVTIPLYTGTSKEIGKALINYVCVNMVPLSI